MNIVNQRIAKLLVITFIKALMNTWQVTEDDRFHICHENYSTAIDMNPTIWEMQRSHKLLVIRITTQPRSRAMNLDFYQQLPQILLKKTGIKGDDVFISIITNNQEDWSFGQGKAQLLNVKECVSAESD